jgi:hypothetical protein
MSYKLPTIFLLRTLHKASSNKQNLIQINQKHILQHQMIHYKCQLD